MRGGASGANGVTGTTGNTYKFTIATPIADNSNVQGFPSELGTITLTNETIKLTNPTKKIIDIQVANDSSQYKTVGTFSTTAGTKVSFKIGSTSNLVSNGVKLNGTTALPGAGTTDGISGEITIKGLSKSSFGTLPSILTFTVITSN